MQDLVRLYAALANNGELRPLRYTNCKPDISNSTALIGRVFGGAREKIQTEIVRKRVLSPEAAFLVLNILGHVPRPELNCADGDNSAPVFWKTGTSHGFRDAWSIGVFDHYVLAVWIGNFDGRPMARSSVGPRRHRFSFRSSIACGRTGPCRISRLQSPQI